MLITTNTPWDALTRRRLTTKMPWAFTWKWWGLAVLLSFLTALFTPYQVAFTPAGIERIDASDVIEFFFSAFFAVDMFLMSILSFSNEGDKVMFGHFLIARDYCKRMFWVDLIAVFPFYPIALACAGLIGQDNRASRYCAILQLFRLVRLYRVKQLISILTYSSEISLMWVIVFRNFGVALLWSHFNACAMYFIARQSEFDEKNTWIGKSIAGLNPAEQYVASLYWSVVTFSTVGYGDYSPANVAEQIWSVIYILLNIIIGAWISGSMIAIMVKRDERTGLERDTLAVLDRYSKLHPLGSFPENFHNDLKDQLRKEFYSGGVADEQVLQTHFPSVVREASVNRQFLHSPRAYVHLKALRTMYVGLLQKTKFMKCLSIHHHQFFDAFLDACNVKSLNQGEKVECPDDNPTLYLVIEGEVSKNEVHCAQPLALVAGDFLNGIEFFTRRRATLHTTLTNCKMLTLSREAYGQIASDHPDAAKRIQDSIENELEEA